MRPVGVVRARVPVLAKIFPFAGESGSTVTSEPSTPRIGSVFLNGVANELRETERISVVMSRAVVRVTSLEPAPSNTKVDAPGFAPKERIERSTVRRPAGHERLPDATAVRQTIRSALRL